MGSGLGGSAGWVAGAGETVCVCVCRRKGGVGVMKEVEDSACVKAALNYISNHQSAANRTGPGGSTLGQPVQN